MRKSLWDKRIPTLLGLLVIVLAIGATTLLTQQAPQFFTRADPTNIPQNIKVTNVRDSSFTVTWTTQKESIGSITFSSENKSEQTVLDDRDIGQEKTQPRKNHTVTATSLSPDTAYVYQIASGGNLYDNNGAPFSVKTASILEEREEHKEVNLSVAGSISKPDGQPAQALIFLQIRDVQPLSTPTDSGKYSFSLSTILTIDLKSYADIEDEDEVIELTFVGDDLTSSKVKAFMKNGSSIPSIVLGKNYDFTINLPATSPSASPLSSFSPPQTVTTNEPTLLSPKEEETFTDPTPVFRGTAPAGAKISITIESEHVIEEEVTAGSNGVWTFTPQTPLSPGTHTITIRVPDASGITRVLTQTFTILPSGSQVVEAATPSATPTIVASPTASPTATIFPTPTPTIPIITSMPKGEISPSPTIQPIPISGAPLPSLVFGAIGLTFTLLGTGLLIFKK